jgi:hemerythrin superfamily protein
MATKQTSANTKDAARMGRTPIGGTEEGIESAEINALALLKDDHEGVSKMFEEYEAADESDKQQIAMDICTALSVHAQIEEEIFYPAAREVLEEDDAELVNEADVEHGAVKQLVAQLQNLDGSDDHFEAMVRVLGEYVRHHVQEEENELFPKVEGSELDLEQLGRRLASRQAELMQQ